MRTSPVYYIAPSAISITPNANGSQRDLAVYVATGTTIKVFCPALGINQDPDFQEWALSGRNRRLADTTGTVPYTIYARLTTSGEKTGYLVFSPKWKDEYDEQADWKDSHPYVTPDGLFWPENVFGNDGYLWIRLGDVLAAENGQRIVTLDTGILGTQLWNTKWNLNPDALPLRIDLDCTTNNEDAGPTPYVYWNQSLVLTATLTEGWTGTEIQRFDHWEITRDSCESRADETWNHPSGTGSYHAMQDGQITLRHVRGVDDDFNGAVAATFTVMAMERNPEYAEGSEADEYLVLKSATINIHAETAEKYNLDLSDSIVTYDPQANTYQPANGVTVTFRITDQRGDMSDLTKGQFDGANLALQYASSGSDTWMPLSLNDTPATAPAAAVIPITAFSAQRSLNLRLIETSSSLSSSESDSSSESESSEEPAVVRLSVASIAFVRDGRTVPGAQGKMCYIAGEYRDDVEYRSDATSTVAVEVAGSGSTTELYILKAQTNVVGGVHYPPKDAGGNVNTDYWEQGLNQYNLIRTKYLFADFANLGSFIVSGDWQFSQYGTLKWYTDGAAQTTEINANNYNSANFGGKVPYMWFKDSDPAGTATPTDDTSTWRFIPTWAVDGKTGKTYQQDVYIRGEVHATSGEFNGTVKANLFYSRTKWFDMPANDYQTYYIDPVSEPYSNFGVAPAQAFHGVVTIYLPIAADYDGIEFTFFSAPFEQYQTGAMDILPKSDDNLYVYSESSKKYVAASAIVPMKGIAKVKSFNGKWFLIEGDPSEAVLKTS